MKRKQFFLSTLERCVLWGVLAGLLGATAFAQLPAQAAQDFQKALEHFRRQDYSSALQVLSSVETQFPNNFDVQHLLAIVLDLKNQPQEANLHFRKAVELNPNSATAYTNYGASLMRLGKPEQAVLQFKRAVALEPGHATACFNLGTIFLGQGKPEEARSWLEQAYEAQPIYENGYQLAFCYFVLGNHLSAQRILDALEGVPRERAEFYFLRVLNEKALGRGQNASQVLPELLPVLAEQPEVQDQVIMLLFSQGMYREAIRVLELAVEHFPDSYSARFNLARARSELGEMTGAKEDASRALELQETGEVHVLLGDISEKLEQPLVAVEHYQQAVRLDPSETNLYALGYEFLAHWTWAAAEPVFERALEQHPESWRLWVGFGAAALGQNESSKAAPRFLKAIEIVPDGLLSYHLLSQSFDQAPQVFDEVVSRFKQFSLDHPENPWAGYYHALASFRAALKAGHPDHLQEAISLLKGVISKKGDFFEAHRLLGEIYFHLKLWNEAAAALQRAVEMDSEHAEAHYKLALALQRSGQSERAKSILKRYQALKSQQDTAVAERMAGTAKFILDLKKP